VGSAGPVGRIAAKLIQPPRTSFDVLELELQDQRVGTTDVLEALGPDTTARSLTSIVSAGPSRSLSVGLVVSLTFSLAIAILRLRIRRSNIHALLRVAC
jgi:hypothetical protein